MMYILIISYGFRFCNGF